MDVDRVAVSPPASPVLNVESDRDRPLGELITPGAFVVPAPETQERVMCYLTNPAG
jgi:hypothetical protein